MIASVGKRMDACGRKLTMIRGTKRMQGSRHPMRERGRGEGLCKSKKYSEYSDSLPTDLCRVSHCPSEVLVPFCSGRNRCRSGMDPGFVVPGFGAKRHHVRPVALAKGRKAGKRKQSESRRKQRSRRDRGAEVRMPENFVSAPLEAWEQPQTAAEEGEDLSDMLESSVKAKLTPLTGTEGAPESTARKRAKETKEKQNTAVGKEPPAITVAKRASWVGLGVLVAIELYVHLIAVGDWIPKR